MKRKSTIAEIDAVLSALRQFEIDLAIRNPYDNRNTTKFLVRVYQSQQHLIGLCEGSRPTARKRVDAWFKERPFLENEGKGPRMPTGRSKTLLATILAATSRAPRRMQSRWSRAFSFIDWEHGNDLNSPKLEWIFEDHGGIRKLAKRAAYAMPARRKRPRNRQLSNGARTSEASSPE